MVNRFGRIGVLMGGVSSERSVSLRSGEAVVNALSQAGYIAQPIDIETHDTDKIIEQLKSASMDVAFIALHGRLGEDGEIQRFLEELNIPYTGSGIKASQMAFDKTLSQKAFKNANLPVARHYIIEDGRKVDFKTVWAIIRQTPVVVKAACEGSSIGVHVVRHPSEWEPAITNALTYGPHVIVEAFIKGREFTVGVLDMSPLPIVEIIPKSPFFSFTAKYQKGLTQYVCPAILPDEQSAKMQQLAVKAYQTLECSGFARVDMKVSNNDIVILEVNTIPGFTETSLFPKAAAAMGMSFLQVCERLLELAYAKKRH